MGALGVPAVTSHVPPYSDIATEENGLFVDSNDVEAWKEGLLQLAQDPIGRLRFGAEAKHYVAQNFDIRKNAHRWFDAYRSLGVK
jgi:glycosyltransferase involved in cell wall biosynthesis